MSQKKDKLPDIESLWDYDDPIGTEKKFKELCEENSKYIVRVDQYLELKTQIARAQCLQLKFEEARESLDYVLWCLDEYSFVPSIRYYLELGRIHINSGYYRNYASDYFSMAYETATRFEEDDYFAVDAALMFAISKPDKAMEWNMKALELCEKSKNPKTKKWLGSICNSIGWVYHNNDEYAIALEFFEKVLAFMEKEKNKESVLIARWAIARALRSLGRVEESLNMLYEISEEIKAKKLEEDPYVYQEIAECLLLQTKLTESFEYIKLSEETYVKTWRLRAFEPSSLMRLEKVVIEDEDELEDELD